MDPTKCTDGLADIDLGILAWRTPATLLQTLKSYEAVGLLQAVGSVTVLLNEATKNDIRIARNFGLNVIEANTNIGIGPAIVRLVEAARNQYFMFLEGDWLCVENENNVRQRLLNGLQLLKDGQADTVRFRHREFPGEPLYSRQLFATQGREAAADFLLESIHWLDHPQDLYHEITARGIDGEDWFFVSSKHANYTNNPCLYTREFIAEKILPKATRSGIFLEQDIHDWWKDQGFTVAQGPGIFTHRPLEKSGHGYSIEGRIRRILGRVPGRSRS